MNLTDLKVARTVAAKPEAVFDVWMDPEPGGPWYGPGRVLIDLKVDGLSTLRWSTRAGRGRTMGDSCASSGLVRCGRRGRVHMDVRGDARVRVDGDGHIAPIGEETEVTLVHSGVPDDEMGRRHAEGWTWMLNMLAERFSMHEEGSVAFQSKKETK